MTNKAVTKKVIDKLDKKKASKLFLSFLDSNLTSTGRATHYNTKEEQEEATKKLHTELYNMDRSLYGLSLLFPGVTDYSMRLGVMNFLSNPVKTETLLDEAQERKLIDKLISTMENQRAFKTFVQLKKDRVCNSRTRKLILRYILNSDSLAFECTKYRKKIADALQHAWGKRLTGIICSILAKSTRDKKEINIIKNNVDKYVDLSKDFEVVYESIRFVFRDVDNLSVKRFKDYIEARKDLSKGKALPKVVLEGIRSTFHKNVSTDKVLDVTKKTMTNKEKMLVQKKAKKAGVKVAFDPMKYESVDLYIYAYETGMKANIKKALKSKAEKTAQSLPFSFEKVGIIVDISDSMVGDEDTQKLRPMAITLALRDVLQNVSDESKTVYGNGEKVKDYSLVYPKNDTSLADEIVDVIDKNDDLEALFILSDGYENAPAGRVDEVIKLLRKIGVDIPIYQFSPVFSSETNSIRMLSKDISGLPVSNPKGLGVSLIKSMMVEDFERGVKGLLDYTIKRLEA